MGFYSTITLIRKWPEFTVTVSIMEPQKLKKDLKS
jgi:hypothetical protein